MNLQLPASPPSPQVPVQDRPRTTAWTLWMLVFASMWWVFPVLIGPLGLLRDFAAWAVLLGATLWHLSRAAKTPWPWSAAIAGMLLGALVNAAVGGYQAYTLARGLAGAVHSDVYGLLHQRNQFATLCLMGIVASTWLDSRRVQTAVPTLLGVLLALSATGLGAAVSFSASRTGLLALGLLWLAGEWTAHGCTPGTTRHAVWALRLGVVGYLLATLPAFTGVAPGVGILARQDTPEGFQVCTSRLSLWSNVWELILRKPWAGWGWGELDYAHFITLFQGERFCALLANAHNLPLHLAVEFGLPAAVAFCGVSAWGIWRAQPWRERHPDRLLAWGILLVIGVHSLLEYPLSYGPFQVWAVIAVVVLGRTPRPPSLGSPRETKRWEPRQLRAIQTLLALALGGLVLVAVDYVRAMQIYLAPTDRLVPYRGDTGGKIRHAIFFQDAIDFARLGLQEVSADNAQEMHALALKMLHYSPEAMVVQKLLDSAQRLGLSEEQAFYEKRFAAAYPEAFIRWKAQQRPE